MIFEIPKEKRAAYSKPVRWFNGLTFILILRLIFGASPVLEDLSILIQSCSAESQSAHSLEPGALIIALIGTLLPVIYYVYIWYVLARFAKFNSHSYETIIRYFAVAPIYYTISALLDMAILTFDALYFWQVLILLIWPLLVSLAWSLPNYIYFKKRKSFFYMLPNFPKVDNADSSLPPSESLPLSTVQPEQSPAPPPVQLEVKPAFCMETIDQITDYLHAAFLEHRLSGYNDSFRSLLLCEVAAFYCVWYHNKYSFYHPKTNELQWIELTNRTIQHVRLQQTKPKVPHSEVKSDVLINSRFDDYTQLLRELDLPVGQYLQAASKAVLNDLNFNNSTSFDRIFLAFGDFLYYDLSRGHYIRLCQMENLSTMDIDYLKQRDWFVPVVLHVKDLLEITGVMSDHPEQSPAPLPSNEPQVTPIIFRTETIKLISDSLHTAFLDHRLPGYKKSSQWLLLCESAAFICAWCYLMNYPTQTDDDKKHFISMLEDATAYVTSVQRKPRKYKHLPSPDELIADRAEEYLSMLKDTSCPIGQFLTMSAEASVIETTRQSDKGCFALAFGDAVFYDFILHQHKHFDQIVPLSTVELIQLKRNDWFVLEVAKAVRLLDSTVLSDLLSYMHISKKPVEQPPAPPKNRKKLRVTIISIAVTLSIALGCCATFWGIPLYTRPTAKQTYITSCVFLKKDNFDSDNSFYTDKNVYISGMIKEKNNQYWLFQNQWEFETATTDLAIPLDFNLPPNEKVKTYLNVTIYGKCSSVRHYTEKIVPPIPNNSKSAYETYLQIKEQEQNTKYEEIARPLITVYYIDYND